MIIKLYFLWNKWYLHSLIKKRSLSKIFTTPQVTFLWIRAINLRSLIKRKRKHTAVIITLRKNLLILIKKAKLVKVYCIISLIEKSSMGWELMCFIMIQWPCEGLKIFYILDRPQHQILIWCIKKRTANMATIWLSL